MSLYNDIKNQIRLIVLDSLSEHPNTQVIFTHQKTNAPEPVGTYCSLYVMGLDQIGRPQQTSIFSTSDSMQFSCAYNLQVQVTFIGDNALDVSSSSYVRLASAVLNRELSQSYNLSITDKSSIRPTPQHRDTKWVDMRSFDLTFFFIGSFTQEIGVVNQVIYEDPITNVEISIPQTITP